MRFPDPLRRYTWEPARRAGVEAVCYACRLGTGAIEIDRPLAITP